MNLPILVRKKNALYQLMNCYLNESHARIGSLSARILDGQKMDIQTQTSVIDQWFVFQMCFLSNLLNFAKNTYNAFLFLRFYTCPDQATSRLRSLRAINRPCSVI